MELCSRKRRTREEVNCGAGEISKSAAEKIEKAGGKAEVI